VGANPYAYGNDDPLDKTDPSGHAPVDPGGCYAGLASLDPWEILFQTLFGDCVQVLPGGDCNGAMYGGNGQPCPGVCKQDPGIRGCPRITLPGGPVTHNPPPKSRATLTGILRGRGSSGSHGRGKPTSRPPALHNPDPKTINVPPQGQTPPPGDTETPEPGTKGPDSGPGDTPDPTEPIGLPNPDEQDPIYHPTEQPQDPDTRTQPMPPDQLPVPLPNPYEMAQDACFDDGTPSEPVYLPMQGAVDNGKKGQRATGVIACLTQVGVTDKSAPKSPFGCDSTTMNKSHLLARSLGGTSEVKNIVPLYKAINAPLMYWGYEEKVAAAVDSGQRVLYEVLPVYDGNAAIPWAVEIHARGSGGFSCDVILYNQAGKSGQRSTC
jgi:hypothetical protein